MLKYTNIDDFNCWIPEHFAFGATPFVSFGIGSQFAEIGSQQD